MKVCRVHHDCLLLVVQCVLCLFHLQREVSAVQHTLSRGLHEVERPGQLLSTSGVQRHFVELIRHVFYVGLVVSGVHSVLGDVFLLDFPH